MHATSSHRWQQAATGPATLAAGDGRGRAAGGSGEAERLRPLPTGFSPLDDILNGGLRAGRAAGDRRAVRRGQDDLGAAGGAQRSCAATRTRRRMYICYEHDRAPPAARACCAWRAPSAGYKDDALTLRRLADLALDATGGLGLIGRLRRMPRYAPIVEADRRPTPTG